MSTPPCDGDTRVEDPAIPLVGMNGRRLHGAVPPPRTYTQPPPRHSSMSLKKHNPRFEHVGTRLALRKELYIKRQKISDASMCMALAGIVIMILETELTAAGVMTREHLSSVFLKMCVTASTVALLIFIFMYYKLGVQLFTVNNSMDDWRLAMRPRRICTFLAECLICIIHPVPGEYFMWWYTTANDGVDEPQKFRIPVDVLLSLPMFLRLYLVCRFLMLHSRLYQDASCQSLGALNRIHFNFRFIFKSFMSLYPDYFLTLFMFILIMITTWSLRLCEMYTALDPLNRDPARQHDNSNSNNSHNNVHGNFFNSLWVIAITFLTVGYGDITPNTHCGRGIAVLTGILGTGCTALIVAILARKMELSRSEKYVHNFVLEVEIGNKLKIEAANIVKNGWKLYKKNKIVDKTFTDERVILRLQTKLLKAIYNIRELRDRRRRLGDNSVSLVEVTKTQLDVQKGVDHLHLRQIAMEERMSRMEALLAQVVDQLSRRPVPLQEPRLL